LTRIRVLCALVGLVVAAAVVAVDTSHATVSPRVGVLHATFVDSTRGVAARGPTPASAERSLQVTIRYPAAVEGENAPARRGVRTLVLFAPGLGLSDATYPRLLHDLAGAGFVVADPEFPLSSGALPGPPAPTDVVDQARDLSFVADRLFDRATRPVPLRRVSFRGRFVAAGHSDGGVTAAGAAANSCCADPRVGAAVILSGALSRFPGGWFTNASTPPVLVIHGLADEVNPISSSEGVYASARPPKWFVAVEGGTHIGAFEDDTTRPAVVALVADFVRATLLGREASAHRLDADATVPGVLELRERE
jgi:predicted dienelactone hydrolase